MSRSWYRVALARDGHAPVVVAAAGDHLGAAVASAEASLAGSFAIAADAATADVVPLGESVGKTAVVPLGDPPEVDAPAFRWPRGVLPRLGAAGPLAGARRGFTVRPDDELLVVEAQTDAPHLTDLFLGMIERLPAADNLEVRVLPHYDGAEGPTDVWLTSRLNARKILRILDEHERDLLENGHLEISVYVRAQGGTLRLTEHKTVVWLAKDAALEADVVRWLGELEVPRSEGLVTIADAPHFHTRPAKSRDRKSLGDQLYRERLRRVDRLGRS